MKKKTGSSRKSGGSKSVKDLRPRATKDKAAKGVRGGFNPLPQGTSTPPQKKDDWPEESITF